MDHKTLQKNAWEREYRDPKMLTKKSEPQSDTKAFLRWLRREEGKDVAVFRVLDIGCGTGRNSEHVASEGAGVTGIDISPTAIRIARERAREAGLLIQYHEGSMAEILPLGNGQVNLVLDVMSSNSLLGAEREAMLAELARVTEPGAYLYLKTLCKEGDENAKELLKKSPGPEADTYRMPTLGIIERVFTEADLRAIYKSLFTFVYLEKKTNYNTIGGRIFKRNYWVGYGKRK